MIIDAKTKWNIIINNRIQNIACKDVIYNSYNKSLKNKYNVKNIIKKKFSLDKNVKDL